MSQIEGGERQQIDQMIAFIEEETNEKIEEIEVKTEEEFSKEKARLGQRQRQEIIEFFERKEKQVERLQRIQKSKTLCHAKLKILKLREDVIHSVLDEVRRRLGNITKDKARYKVLLEKLILETLYYTLESKAVLRCRKADKSLVQQVIDSCADQYKTNIGRDVSIVVDTDNYLPANSCGGIETFALDGRIKATNTLESRFELITKKLLPEIRYAIFGTNPNRKFNN